MKIRDLDKKVRAVLKTDERSRDSDVRLTQVVWYTYYKSHFKMVDGEWYINVNAMYDLPREDNIKRIRAKIQNVEKLYLPTDIDVAKKRGWNEQEWRSYLNGSEHN